MFKKLIQNFVAKYAIKNIDSILDLIIDKVVTEDNIDKVINFIVKILKKLAGLSKTNVDDKAVDKIVKKVKEIRG